MEKAGYLGCDVSKGHCDFLLLNSEGNVLEKPFSLEDNKVGKSKLKELIDQWMNQGITMLYCGVESTGGYEMNWFRYLSGLSKKLPIQVAKLNPKGVKGVSEALLRRTITDAVSAENIAMYLIHFSGKVRYSNNSAIEGNSQFSEGRQQGSYIKMLTKQKVQLGNQLEKLLYQNFSEILKYCRHGFPDWVLRLLVKYPGAKSISKAGLNNINKIQGIGAEKALGIMKNLEGSEQLVSPQIQHVISVTAKEILHKEILIADEKKYLAALYEDHELVLLLSTFNGIGVNSAIGLLLEIEDINRFQKCPQMTSYFGVHPIFKQSGDGKWGSHMSKTGRSEIRAALYMIAMTGIRSNPLLKALYARYRAKGFNHYQAMGVLMHKILRIVYGMLKNKTAFDINIDQANVEKAKAKQMIYEETKKSNVTENIKSKDRFNTPSQDAPISRRKYQKNKKENMYLELTPMEKAGFLNGNPITLLQ